MKYVAESAKVWQQNERKNLNILFLRGTLVKNLRVKLFSKYIFSAEIKFCKIDPDSGPAVGVGEMSLAKFGDVGEMSLAKFGDGGR
jgi:hypothetical protein